MLPILCVKASFLLTMKELKVLCKNAPDAVNELVDWGARFHREKDGRLTQRFFGAHTYRRTVFYEDWTGQEIIRVLLDQVTQRKIEIVDDVYITRLLESRVVKKTTNRSRRSIWHKY